MWRTLFPFLRWFPMSGGSLRADLLAGVTVALILVPQSMAYAQLAGLPVVYGLYAAFIPVMVASLWGSSSQLHTGPVAMLSLMSAAAVVPLAAVGTERFIELSVMLALIVGVFRLALGLLRLGVIVNFLSSPVIIGFTNAAALIIGLSQFSKILSVPFPRSDSFLSDLWVVVQQIPQTHLPTLGFALAALAIIFGLKRVAPRVPGILAAVLITTALSWAIGFENSETVAFTQVQHAETQQRLDDYRANQVEIASLEEAIQEYNARIRALATGESDDGYAERATLEAERSIRRHRAERLKRVNDALLVDLHRVRLARVDGAATPQFVGAEEGAGPIWRVRSVTGDQVTVAAGGAVVGTIPAGLPSFATPSINWGDVILLLPSALVMALIGFMEATSISKAIAAKTRERVDTSKELVGQGLANIVGSFFSSYTVSGSFSRSAVAARSGATTGLFAIFSAIAVMIVLLFFTPLLYHLPQAVLAVIVMMAVFGLINVRGLVQAWKVERHGAVIGVVTFVATLLFAPQLANGILLGVALTVILFLVRTMRPRAEILGRKADGTLGGVATHGIEPLGRNFVAVRFDGSLNFVNASHFEETILEALSQVPSAKAVLVIGSGINNVDASGEERLRAVADYLRDNGIDLYVTSLKSQVMSVLDRGDVWRHLPKEHLFATKEQGLATMLERYDRIRDAKAPG